MSSTSIEALFALFKGEFGVSHRELATLILSSHPLADGMSPAQRAENTTWLTRYVVHAPMDSLQDRLFADFSLSARRVHHLLGQRCRADRDIFQVINGSSIMTHALGSADQKALVYRNALLRLNASFDDATEKARAALILTIASGCTDNVTLAIRIGQAYLRSNGLPFHEATPCPDALAQPSSDSPSIDTPPDSIGLIRLIDNRVASGPYRISTSGAGTTIGALALGKDAIADVNVDVSAEHLRVWRSQGHWLAQDLNSTNGSALIRSNGSCVFLTPGASVEIVPGDCIKLANNTLFSVIAMAAESSTAKEDA